MKRCPSCGEARLRAGAVAHSLSVAGQRFGGSLPARTCVACGEEVVRAEHLALFELAAAKWLAESGRASPVAFRFMRKAVGMRAAHLAELLDATPETVSRWENGALPVESRAFALLGSIVSDRFEGRSDTEDRLRARLAPRRRTGIVRLAATRPRKRARAPGSAAAG